MSISSTNNIDLPPLQVTPPGLYRHYKGGWYEVIDTVRCSETLKGIDLDTVLRAPPAAPTTCCGRGCDGCVWAFYFVALRQWRDDVCNLLSKTTDASR